MLDRNSYPIKEGFIELLIFHGKKKYNTIPNSVRKNIN